MVAKYDFCNAIVWIMKRVNEKAENTEHQYDRKEMTDLVSQYIESPPIQSPNLSPSTGEKLEVEIGKITNPDIGTAP